MSKEILYPDETAQVHRRSSAGQFSNFLSVMKDGTWSPVVFNQLDGIRCETVKSHPIILELRPTLGYIYPEKRCVFVKDDLVSYAKEGVEEKLLPEEFGGTGDEWYQEAIDEESLVGLAGDTPLGLHTEQVTRVGLDYVVSDETLPAVD